MHVLTVYSKRQVVCDEVLLALTASARFLGFDNFNQGILLLRSRTARGTFLNPWYPAGSVSDGTESVLQTVDGTDDVMACPSDVMACPSDGGRV